MQLEPPRDFKDAKISEYNDLKLDMKLLREEYAGWFSKYLWIWLSRMLVGVLTRMKARDCNVI